MTIQTTRLGSDDFVWAFLYEDGKVVPNPTFYGDGSDEYVEVSNYLETLMKSNGDITERNNSSGGELR